MTHPIPSSNSGELVERLLKRSGFGVPPGMLINPDGPEAATIIKHLEHEKAELIHDIGRAQESLNAEVNARLEAERQLEVAREALTTCKREILDEPFFSTDPGLRTVCEAIDQALSNISGQG